MPMERPCVRVLYFAAVRELVGIDEESIELPDGVQRIEALARELERRHPSLAGRLAAVRFARNQTFAAPDEPLEDGDEVALIPPVAGG